MMVITSPFFLVRTSLRGILYGFFEFGPSQFNCFFSRSSPFHVSDGFLAL